MEDEKDDPSKIGFLEDILEAIKERKFHQEDFVQNLEKKIPEKIEWQYKVGDEDWESYDSPISSQMEMSFQNDPNSSFEFIDISKINHLFFDFNKMTEMNENTGKFTEIRRETITVDTDIMKQSFKQKFRARLFSNTNEINGPNIENYLEALLPSRKKVVYENLMNYGLTNSKGDSKDPLVKLLKDSNPISNDSDESFQKILDEVTSFITNFEKNGDHKILLKTGTDILIKESKEKKPNLEKYLNRNVQLKLISEVKKKMKFAINECVFNLIISKKHDGRFKFKIDSKEKKLNTWMKNMISFLKSSHLKYISVSAFLSRCIHEYDSLFSTLNENKENIEVDKNILKDLKEKYIYTWGETDSVKSELPFIHETNLYIKKQFENLMKKGYVLGNENSNLNLDINVRSPNPFLWFVQFSKFPSDSLIGKDLKVHSKKYNSDEKVLLEVKFTADFPLKPPYIRVLSPRFIYSTGNITTQGNLSLDILSPKIWSTSSDMIYLLECIRSNFIDSGARVDLRLQKLYEKSPMECSTPKESPFTKFDSILNFEQDYFAFSSNFASRCFNGFYHHKLENANNLILPVSAAKVLRKTNSIEPISIELSTKIFHCYCGILDFCAPKNSVIVPNWMMKDMMMEEGTKITLRSLNIPLCEMVTFRPLSKSFYNFKNTAMLMTRALQPFVTLYQGQCVPLRIGGSILILEVISFDPPSRAARIQKNYNEYHDLKINFETALDFEENSQKGLTRKNSLIQQKEETSKSLEKTKSLSQMNVNQDTVVDHVQCTNCKKDIRKGTLDIHLMHCKKNFYYCSTCDCVVKFSDKLEHEKNSHKTEICIYCSESIHSCKLESHQIECQLEEIQPCLYCKLEFSSKEIEVHMNECLKIEHQCEQCGLLFHGNVIIQHSQSCCQLYFDEYYQHEEEQDEEEKLSEGNIFNDDPGSIAEGTLACTYCGLQNQTKDSLKNHVITNHPEDPEQFLMVLEFL
jgi:hypothetical protein